MPSLQEIASVETERCLGRKSTGRPWYALPGLAFKVAVAAVLVTAFDPSPLLFIAAFIALCAYIVIDRNQRRT
jgi:hypothetical protein